MAVTTWLARLSEDDLTRAMADALSLEEICSGGGVVPFSDLIDLNWAPHSFDLAAKHAGLDRATLEALALATEGRREVISGHRSLSSQYDSPRYLDAEEVRQISAVLDALDPTYFLGTHVTAEDHEPGTDLEGWREFVAVAFEDMRTFYREASARGCSVVSFYD